jgi:hypothetical protein
MIRIRINPRATLLAALALFVLYLLALGPALWLICQNAPRWMVAIFSTVYEPLDLLAHRSSTIKDWLSAYAKIWLPANPTREPPPTPPIRSLQVFLAGTLACWFIWNVVGWFAPKDPPALDPSDPKDAHT